MTNHCFDRLAGLAGSERPLIVGTADGATLSYAAFFALVGRMAAALTAAGVVPGDRVAAQVEKSPEALALYLAALRTGAVYLPLNTAYTLPELDYFIGDAAPRLMICDPSRAADIGPVAARHDARLLALDGGGRGSLADAAAAAPEPAPPAPRGRDDLAAMLYTSGTTGRPKGAMLTHGNLLSNAETLVDAWRFTAADRLIHALPIYHTHGLFVATNTVILAGGTLLFLPKFDAAAVVKLLPRATALMGVPTFYTRLLAEPGLSHAAAAGMRLFVSGSAPLLAETHRAFAGRTGHRILERYGMTETNMNTSNPYEGDRRAGTVGLPLPGVALRITAPETGAPLPEGAIGMIEVKGPNVFAGYWRMPEKTAAEFRPDGFFITGDLGKIDADGYVSIVGRGKDLVISGGFNVYPKEVESEIDALPGVLESAVFGVPHPDFGEAVVAVVVALPGATLDEAAALAALRARLAAYKLPKRIVPVDDLPRNAMGKVQKNLLRDRYAALFAPEA